MVSFSIDFEVVASNVPRLNIASFEATISGNDRILLAVEGSGSIRIDGGVTSFSFTSDRSENFWGFTVGVGKETTPEPAAIFGLLMMAGLGMAIQRKHSATTEYDVCALARKIKR